VKGGSIKSPKEAIRGVFGGRGVRGKGVRIRDIRTVSGHRNEASCNSKMIKVRGLIESQGVFSPVD
jgi:hypothetical protein